MLSLDWFRSLLYIIFLLPEECLLTFVRQVLMVMNLLFCLSEKVFISSLLSKDNFVRHKFQLGGWFLWTYLKFFILYLLCYIYFAWYYLSFLDFLISFWKVLGHYYFKYFLSAFFSFSSFCYSNDVHIIPLEAVLQFLDVLFCLYVLILLCFKNIFLCISPWEISTDLSSNSLT